MPMYPTTLASRAWSLLVALGTSAVLSLSLSSAARADLFHSRGIPLGSRALGFGGAFTGIADDPSAAYYNPAGLVWAGDNALSASFALSAYDLHFVERGYRTPFGTGDVQREWTPSLPVTGGFSKHFGKGGDSKEPAHTIGLSTFSVDQRSLSVDTQVRDALRTGVATLSVENSTQTTWNGASYACRLSDRLALGLSGFFSIAKRSYREELIQTLTGQPDFSSGSFQSEAGAWSSYRVTSNVKSVLVRIGALYRVNEKLRLGLMVQPPSIQLRGRASVRQRFLDLDAAFGGDGFRNVEQRGLTSRHPFPTEIRLGSAYQPFHWFTLALDGSFYAPVGSRHKPLTAVGARSPDPETGAVAEVGHFQLERYYRKASGDVALGVQFIIREVVAIRAGFFTSLSAAPDVPRVSMQYTAPDIDRYGATMSVGIQTRGYDLSLGTAMLFGVGEGLALDTRPEAVALYQRSTAVDGTLFVFITGARSAMTTLAKSAAKKVEEWQR